jgi:hypothetical protein
MLTDLGLAVRRFSDPIMQICRAGRCDYKISAMLMIASAISMMRLF